MLRKILITLAAVLAVLAVIIATRPGSYRYSRSLVINAPPELLFAQVNDLRKFQLWNPWAKVDPQAVITYDGPASGPGAAYSWAGGDAVGEGTMTITGTKPHEWIKARMDFRKPMPATSTAEFTFTPASGGTQVTWSMSGDNNFMAKAFGLLMDMDQMIGGEFAKGLATLETLAESDPPGISTAPAPSPGNSQDIAGSGSTAPPAPAQP